MPRSTASRWRAPWRTASSASPAAIAAAIVAWWRGRGVDDAAHLGAVACRGQQAVELVGVEQPGEHLAVHLDEQRVAARPGDRGVEAAVEAAELGESDARPERAGRPSAISARSSSSARSAASSMIGSSKRAAGLEELADEALRSSSRSRRA